MKALFETIQKNIRVKVKTYTIDNIGFRLHYKLTSLLLILSILMLTSQELIGENIKCMADKGVPEEVINRFCYFTSTFTVVKYLDDDMVNTHAVAHPGVGPMPIHSDEPIKRHAYYQWVPFVLLLQAIMFYAPHAIWKYNEGGRMRKLVSGLEYAAYSADNEFKVNDTVYPARKSIQTRLAEIRTKFRDHVISNASWTSWFIFCEVLNLLNLVFQVFLTDVFLGGQFLTLGVDIVLQGLESKVDVLDVVFPKMTKCTFHKFGPSGTMQAHDALCVMALNVINEKIFYVMWFWFAFLLLTSVFALVWRCLTFFLHSSSIRFNRLVFTLSTDTKTHDYDLRVVMENCSFRDWLFLVYLGSNMDGVVFSKFLTQLADEFNDYPEHEPLYARTVSKTD